MSYLYSKPRFGQDRFPDIDDLLPFIGSRPRGDRSADGAIDSELRSVPLPDGLMTRLSMLVHTMPDDAADHVDYLSFRPSARVLTAGYVHPAIKK